ncbi:hypothetical protein [Sphingomonas abietis]|uniref:Energy transducer TonB n=1 Tax=Sphingomonas abietis TaxID=3012344 RepID=A0ABY7NM97_9SPHN|nr:hypothetical protein [Sphingomonas abietis]WBO21601.1 hypothetical protein PBT88_15665 [Sphingomonas abietis]
MPDNWSARRRRFVNGAPPDRRAGLTRSQVVSLLVSALVWAIILIAFLQSLIVRFTVVPEPEAVTVEHEFALLPPPPVPRPPLPPPIVPHRPRPVARPLSKGSAPPNHDRRTVVADVPDLPVVPLSIDRPVMPLSTTSAVVGPSAPAQIGDNGAGSGSGPGKAAGDGRGDGSAPFSFSAADWIRKPTEAEIAKVDPFRARLDHVSGFVMLSCLIDDHARAKRCHVLSETPRDYGFGAAALSLTHLFRVRVANIDGTDMNRIPARIPIAFFNRAPENK